MPEPQYEPLPSIDFHATAPPLGDAATGAFAAATVLSIVGVAGIEEAVMAKGALAVMVLGLVLSVLSVVFAWLAPLALSGRPPRWQPRWSTLAISATCFAIAAWLMRDAAETGLIAPGTVSLAAVGLVSLFVGGVLIDEAARLWHRHAHVVGERAGTGVRSLAQALPSPRRDKTHA